MALKIVPKQTVLLLLDFQKLVTDRLNLSQNFIQRTQNAIAKARISGITIAHCAVAFTDEDIAALPATNFSFARLLENSQVLASLCVGGPGTAFHADISPEAGDMEFRKTHVGPFMGGPSTDMHAEFQKGGIDTMIIAGLATSGAVLSAVRQAADLDYRIMVLEDCCEDGDAEVQRVMMEKVFTRQAYVVKAERLEELIV